MLPLDEGLELSLPDRTPPCEFLLIEYHGSLLRMRILVVVPLVVALPMVVPPSSAKSVLVLYLILV